MAGIHLFAQQKSYLLEIPPRELAAGVSIVIRIIKSCKTDANAQSLPKPTSERITAHTPKDVETINIENYVAPMHKSSKTGVI